MNTKMLMLGILLLAGLSFADKGGPDNWMQMSEGRYYCNLVYMGYNLFSYAAGPLGATPEQIAQMEDHLYGDGTPGMAESASDMYYAAECVSDGGADPMEFRQALLAYNADSLGFRSAFNQAVRDYLTENPNDREHIYEELVYFNGLYRNCLSLGEYCNPVPR